MHYENCINHCVGVFRNSVVRLKSGHFIFVVSFGFEVWLGKDVHNGSGDRFGLVRGVGGAAYMGVSLARCNSYTNTQADRYTQTHNCTKNTQIWISSLSGRGVWPEFNLDLDSLLDVWFGKHVSSQVSQCFNICAHLKTSKIQGGALKWCIRKILSELEVAPPYELLTLLTLLAIHALHEKTILLWLLGSSGSQKQSTLWAGLWELFGVCVMDGGDGMGQCNGSNPLNYYDNESSCGDENDIWKQLKLRWSCFINEQIKWYWNMRRWVECFPVACQQVFCYWSCTTRYICQATEKPIILSHFYRTRVRSLAMLVTHWLTHSLTHSRLVNLSLIIVYLCH